MYRTKWHGQNCMDKMVWDKMVWDKMVWTKWYGQNGTDKMVVIFRIDYNSSEFNSYLVTKSHSEMINIQRRLMILLLKSYPYHSVRTILSVPFCPIPFCPYHFVRSILSATILS